MGYSRVQAICEAFLGGQWKGGLPRVYNPPTFRGALQGTAVPQARDFTATALTRTNGFRG